MNLTRKTSFAARRFNLVDSSWLLLVAALLITLVVYWPGLSGGWIFDDSPNIVDNDALHLQKGSGLGEWLEAALSSPSSRFKRPLASLSFAANHIVGELNPWGWKAVNLFIHLANGVLLFWLSRGILNALRTREALGYTEGLVGNGSLAALIAACWLLLPINLTAVLYVVQRMESMANLFILLGLCGYLDARSRMLTGQPGFLRCGLWLVLPALAGLAAKETAVMLPLYALVIEWLIFGFSGPINAVKSRYDQRLFALYGLVLLLPMLIGLAWVMPELLRPGTWASRNFTLETRLLSEARILVEYLGWTLLPLPQWLSFYHDDYPVSQSLLEPLSTLLSIGGIVVLLGLAVWLRRQLPLFALGVFLYFAGHLLTATILPLELVFEHRNYFASYAVLLVAVPLLIQGKHALMLRRSLLVLLLIGWAATTAFTARTWADSSRLTLDLANRAPNSARAQYDLGRMLMRLTNYDSNSTYTEATYRVLEHAASLPHTSLLPLAALLELDVRMHGASAEGRWDALLTQLEAKSSPSSQDQGALAGLTKCAVAGDCAFEPQHMIAIYEASLARSVQIKVLAAYSDYLWNVIEDREQALILALQASHRKPDEAAYVVTVGRMATVLGRPVLLRQQILLLEQRNRAGRYSNEIASLYSLLSIAEHNAK